eukprot:m.1618980 g.1618980  ORF g.1618980 m.1618980 type:complete len:52 (+) comp25378_c0_seq10:73-228(+)
MSHLLLSCHHETNHDVTSLEIALELYHGTWCGDARRGICCTNSCRTTGSNF